MRLPLLALVAVPVLLTGCQLTEPAATESEGDGAITVTSTADGCDVATAKAPAGNLVFRVSNEGSETTEFYLYAEDGRRIVGEVENITPGLTRDLVVAAQEGTYVTSCRPGMKGDGIRSDFTVTEGTGEASAAGVDEAALTTATRGYASYVQGESTSLVAATERFLALYRAGQDDRARALYAPARVHWERIETVAESFGDLDPRMDAREADLEPGQAWTGWHRIEKDLWPPQGFAALSRAERVRIAGRLMADTRTLDGRVQEMEFTLDQIGNGSKGLLDEVATGKVTGEEEIWSHTDLYDFQANVDGAEAAFELLEPILRQKDDALADQIARRFEELNGLLEQYREGDGFVSYDTVGQTERRELSDAVNALAEPLSRLTGAVTL